MQKKISLSILLFSRISRSFAAGMLAISFPYFVLNNLHLSTFLLGTLFAVATVFTAFFGLFFGIITDIWGRKKTLLVATLMLPLACFMLWYSDSVQILFIASILGGFSATGSLAGGGIGGSVQPIQNAILADLIPADKRTFFYSTFAFLNGVAAAIGTIFIRFLNEKEIFITAGIISLLGTIILIFLRVPSLKGQLRKLSGKITIGKFTLTGFLNGVSQGLVTPFMIPFFIIVYKLSENTMSTYAFISGTIAAFALLAAPYLDKKFGFVKSIVYSRGLSALLILLLPIFKFLPISLFIYLVTPALRVVSVPIQQTALTSLVSEEERGRALGINQVVRLAGSSVATEVAGSLFYSNLIALPFYLYFMTMGANIYLYKIFFKKEEKLRTL